MKRPTLLAGIVSIAVFAAVVAGFIVHGSPKEERMRRFDQQRVNHLQQIQNAVDNYWNSEKKLPESLNAMTNSPTYYIDPSVKDPETGSPYEYRVVDEDSYELCGTFSIASEKGEGYPEFHRAYPGAPGGSFWKHDAGRTCFSLDAVTWPRP